MLPLKCAKPGNMLLNAFWGIPLQLFLRSWSLPCLRGTAGDDLRVASLRFGVVGAKRFWQVYYKLALYPPRIPFSPIPSPCLLCCSAFCSVPYLPLCCLSPPQSATCHTQRLPVPPVLLVGHPWLREYSKWMWLVGHCWE